MALKHVRCGPRALTVPDFALPPRALAPRAARLPVRRAHKRRAAPRRRRTLDHPPEDQPNTPSKSKLLPQRSLRFYGLLIALALVSGFLAFQREFAGGAAPPALAAADLGGAGAAGARLERPGGAGTRAVIENSEARQREALEIADTILQHEVQAGLEAGGRARAGSVALSAGGGSVTAAAVPLLEDEAPAAPDDAPRAPGAPPGEPAAPAELDEQQQQQQQQQPDEGGGGGAAAPAPPPPARGPVAVRVRLDGGRVREVQVPAARVAALDAMSDGLESEDFPAAGDPAAAWWTGLIAGGDAGSAAAPAAGGGRSAGAAAAAAAALARAEPPATAADDQCRIAVLDVNLDLGPLFHARRCNLTYKRVWPFSRFRAGIDGAETLPPEHYQYSTEYWIAQAVRNSSRHEPDAAKADVVFVDMWCYHAAWLAYIHPLGATNTTNPEPYIRKAMATLLAMDRCAAFCLFHSSISTRCSSFMFVAARCCALMPDFSPITSPRASPPPDSVPTDASPPRSALTPSAPPPLRPASRAASPRPRAPTLRSCSPTP